MPTEVDGGASVDGGAPDVPVIERDAPSAIDVQPDAPATDAGACPRPGEAPSDELLALHETLIRPGCVGAGRFCHEGGYEGFAMLTPELTLTNLVNVAGCAEVRVVPCQPEASYVLEVMRTGGEVCGRPLPDVSGVRHPTFSAAEIATFEVWIRNGAR